MYQYLSYFDLYSQQIFSKPLEFDNLVMTRSSFFFFCSYKFNVFMFLNSKKLFSGTAMEPVFLIGSCSSNFESGTNATENKVTPTKFVEC